MFCIFILTAYFPNISQQEIQDSQDQLRQIRMPAPERIAVCFICQEFVVDLQKMLQLYAKIVTSAAKRY